MKSEGEIVLELVKEAMRERNTKQGYKRAVRALSALNIGILEYNEILYAMNYTDASGKPWKWLTEKRIA